MISKHENSDCFIEAGTGNSPMPYMHFHSHYEIYFLEAGAREFFVGDKIFATSVGSFVLIPPKTLHRTGGEFNYSRTLMGFSEEFLLETYKKEALPALLKCFEGYFITPPDSKFPHFRTVLKNMAQCRSRLDFSIWMGVLLTELSKCEPGGNDGDAGKGHLNQIVGYINNNFPNIRSIDEIAKHFYISKSYLCRKFKKSMKVSLIEYLNSVKIKNACFLIESSDKKMIQIAHLCGFNSSAYFSNVFKKVLGKTPRDYKKESHLSHGV